MAKKRDEKTIFDYLYDYQTRLQGVANDLGIRLGALMISSDAKILKLLRSELPKYKDGQKELERLEKLVSKIEAVRNPTYSAARDMVLETSADVVQAATSETAKEFNQTIAEQRRKIREKRFCKELTKKQQESVIEGQGIDGATVADWFWKWKRGDLERLSSLAKRASVESMTVSQITRAAKGTIENNYDDGVFTETRVSAARMARTIINGVSNNARVETIVQNSDAIDGVKFVGTLDGKTCPYCASYDGYIWRGEEIAEARRPPIHPNCRCCLVPYVELKDEEGNVVDVDGDRPAANADFDKLAQDAYNEHAREKGWKRRWDDLSPSTRLKYYYQAQKDYEERTGKPAYRQVSGATTFQEYFHKQPDSFKRAWLGAKRFELYKAGRLKEKNIFKPDMTYQVSVESLVRDGFRSISQKTIEKILKTETDKTPLQKQSYAPKDQKYMPVNIDWHSEILEETFKAEERSSITPDFFRFFDESDLKEVLQKELPKYQKEIDEALAKAEPNRSEFSSEENFQKAHRQWEKNKAGFSSFLSLLKGSIKTVLGKVDVADTQAREKFKHPFDSIREPSEYLKDESIKKELKRINEQYETDRNSLGEKEATRRRLEALRRLILPEEPEQKTIDKLFSKLPKEFVGLTIKKDKRQDDFMRGTREGLTFFARVVKNLGRDWHDVEQVKISKTVVDRGFYNDNDKTVRLTYRKERDVSNTYFSFASVVAHEFGHALDYNASDGVLARVNRFYDNHSARDKKGNPKTFIINQEKRRQMTIKIPDPTGQSYTTREYLDSSGNVEATELTSQFMRFLYMCPETFFEKEFSDYYEGMIQCLKKQK